MHHNCSLKKVLGPTLTTNIALIEPRKFGSTNPISQFYEIEQESKSIWYYDNFYVQSALTIFQEITSYKIQLKYNSLSSILPAGDPSFTSSNPIYWIYIIYSIVNIWDKIQVEYLYYFY